MSEQYPTAPHYTAGYQNANQYSPFPPNVSQTSPTTSMFQQSTMSIHNQQMPVAQANDLRFNANMQISPQSAPFPFPPSLNPDLFKHLPPPPPPPPPASFLSNPGTPVNFPHLTGQSIGMAPAFTQQGYPGAHTVMQQLSGGPVQQTSPGFPSYSTDIHGVQVGRDQPSHNNILEPGSSYPRQSKHEAGSFHPFNAQEYQPEEDFLPQRNENNREDSDMYDPANAFRIDTDAVSSSKTFQNKFPQQQQAPTRHVHTNGSDGTQRILSFTENVSQEELKEKAKAAILALSSHRISYNDLIAEGLDSDVLQTLFAELGLDMNIQPQLIHKPAAVIQEDDQRIAPSEAPSRNGRHIATSTVAATEPNRPSLPEQSTVSTSGMERKDRIAQLLAAKAAKAGVAGITSPSASPASASGSMPPKQAVKDEPHGLASNDTPARFAGGRSTEPVASSEDLQQHLSQLQNDAGEILRGAGRTSTPSVLTSLLPTPIRETLMKSGLSSMIPGLFDDGDEDQAKELPALQSLNTDGRGEVEIEGSSTAANLSKKRSPGPSSDLQQRTAKRPAIVQGWSKEVRMEGTGSESGEASEGEIIESNLAQSHSAYKDHERHRSPAESKRSSLPRDTTQSQLGSSMHISGTKSALSEAARGVPAASSPRPISKLTPTQLAERAAQLKADLLRQRRIRQQQLTEGIPALDEEVVKTQQRIEQSKIRLAEIRAQLQKYEAEAARARQSEIDILEEIQRLETQLEDGMNGQKRFSNELEQIKSHAKDIVPSTRISPSEKVNALSAETARSVTVDVHQPSIVLERSGSPEVMDNRTLPPDASVNETLNHVTSTTQSFQEVAANGSGLAHQTENQPKPADIGVKEDSNINTHPVQTEHMDSEESTVSSTNQTNKTSEQAMSEQDWDAKSQDSRMSIDEESEDGSAGSASMSDSGSEDYEPVDQGAKAIPEAREDDSEEYEPEEDGSLPSEPEDNADEYEPSEMIEANGHDGSPGDSPDDEQQHGTTSATSPYEHKSIDQSNSVPGQPDQRISNVSSHQMVSNLEDNSQPQDASTLSQQEPMMDVEMVESTQLDLDTGLMTGPHYVPYQSPLSSFKSYRFHSSFNDKVKTGYRSLTYSNQIDPKTPLCPTELAGEICRDPNCQEQHFGSMALSDDRILVQMSSANDIADIALRDEYLAGLKQVIASLQERDVKDFSEVANALSCYRRDWLAAHLDG